MGGTYGGTRGKSSSHRAYYRIFMAGTKGRDLGDFGRNKSGKIGGQGDKKGQAHVNSLLLSKRLTVPCAWSHVRPSDHQNLNDR